MFFRKPVCALYSDTNYGYLDLLATNPFYTTTLTSLSILHTHGVQQFYDVIYRCLCLDSSSTAKRNSGVIMARMNPRKLVGVPHKAKAAGSPGRPKGET